MNYNKTYFDTINERFSCRNFTDKKISDEEVKNILNAARLAPTAVNYQPEHIYVVEDPILLDKLKTATRFTFDAKTIFVVCYDKNVSWHRGNDGKDHGDIDCAIIATHMMLAVTAMGLGSCYVCSMKENIVKEILDIPSNYVVSCLLPVGYPKEIKPHGSRRSLDEIVIYK